MSDEIKWKLLRALSFQDIEKILRLLKLLSNPHKVKYSSDNCTILHIAARCGMLDLVHVLINEYQFDPHCVNDHGATPLHYAASNGQVNVVKHLITEFHCNPLSKGKYGTPLDYADAFGDQDVIRYLKSVVTADRLLESSLTTAMKEGGGEMKPHNITMHGPPGAGKTSLKRVIIGLPPLPSDEQNATDIVENAVRAVNTDRFTADGRRSVMLTEVNNEELIKMLARKVESHCVTSHQTQEPQHKPVSNLCVCVSECVCVCLPVCLCICVSVCVCIC